MAKLSDKVVDVISRIEKTEPYSTIMARQEKFREELRRQGLEIKKDRYGIPLAGSKDEIACHSEN